MRDGRAGRKDIRDAEGILSRVHRRRVRRCRVPNGSRQPVLRLDKSRWYKLGVIGMDAASSAQSKCTGAGIDVIHGGSELRRGSATAEGCKTVVAGGSDAGYGETALLQGSWGKLGSLDGGWGCSKGSSGLFCLL